MGKTGGVLGEVFCSLSLSLARVRASLFVSSFSLSSFFCFFFTSVNAASCFPLLLHYNNAE